MSNESENAFRQELMHKLNLILDSQMVIIRTLQRQGQVKDPELGRITHLLSNEIVKIRISKMEF